jgi:hypothetical protein
LLPSKARFASRSEAAHGPNTDEAQGENWVDWKPDFMIAKGSKCMLFLRRQLKRPTTSLAACLPTPQ